MTHKLDNIYHFRKPSIWIHLGGPTLTNLQTFGSFGRWYMVAHGGTLPRLAAITHPLPDMSEWQGGLCASVCVCAHVDPVAA